MWIWRTIQSLFSIYESIFLKTSLVTIKKHLARLSEGIFLNIVFILRLKFCQSRELFRFSYIWENLCFHTMKLAYLSISWFFGIRVPCILNHPLSVIETNLWSCSSMYLYAFVDRSTSIVPVYNQLWTEDFLVMPECVLIIPMHFLNRFTQEWDTLMDISQSKFSLCNV